MIPGIRSPIGILKYRGLSDKPVSNAILTIYNNYSNVMSGMQVNGGINLVPKIARSTTFGDSAGRYQNSFVREWSPGISNNTDLNQTDVNTIIFIGMGNDIDLVYPSNVSVNNVAVTLTNWFANSTYIDDNHVPPKISGRTIEVSYLHYYDTFDSIRYLNATFDGPGTGANEFAGATMIVLPGKWQPNNTISISPSNTNVSVSMSNSEIGLYFGSHERDTIMVDATVNTGIQIGYNSGNWYGGQSVGLLYSNTGIAQVNVVTNSASSTRDRCIIAKLEWVST